MDYKNYGTERFKMCVTQYDGILKTAVNKLYGVVQSKLPYVLTIESDYHACLQDVQAHYIVLGTQEHPCFKHFKSMGLFTISSEKEGYSIKVMKNPCNPNFYIFLLQGTDSSGALYAVVDFIKEYVFDLCQYNGYHYNKKYQVFVDEPLLYEKISAPKIEHRGLWTWGHVIYDYRGYIDQMVNNKMNTLIMWNDYVPLNAKDIIEYAHRHAVKVVWGYSWCWGEKVDPTDEAQLAYWTNHVISTYENQYKALDIDGIYFQAFTETHDTVMNGRSISDLVIEWVQKISKNVYEKYPNLWIQFGIHASSIQNECTKFNQIDNRMTLVWEDAGGFPYHYDPRTEVDHTRIYNQTLANIRGKNERFGAVFKGFTVLNWDLFEHQKGSLIVGESDKAFIQQHTADKAFYWRFLAPYWINKAPFLQQILKDIASAPIHDRLITALVEDGMLESQNHMALALFSELLWNPFDDVQSVLQKVMHQNDSL